MKTEQEVQKRITELQTEINSMLIKVTNATKVKFTIGKDSVARDTVMALIANAQTIIETNQKDIETLLWVLNPHA